MIYTVQIASSTGSEVFLTGLKPHCLEPVVELCSAKEIMHELHKSAEAWLLQMQMLQDKVVDTV